MTIAFSTLGRRKLAGLTSAEPIRQHRSHYLVEPVPGRPTIIPLYNNERIPDATRRAIRHSLDTDGPRDTGHPVRSQYTIAYRRSPDIPAWHVHISELLGCHSYGESLQQARGRVRDALGVFLDRPVDDITLHERLPRTFTAITSEVTRAREAAVQAEAHAREATADAVHQLVAQGLHRRDIARLLNLTGNRLYAILGPHPRPGPAAQRALPLDRRRAASRAARRAT